MQQVIISILMIGAYIVGRYTAKQETSDLITKLHNDLFSLRKFNNELLQKLWEDEKVVNNEKKEVLNQTFWEVEEDFHDYYNFNHTE